MRFHLFAQRRKRPRNRDDMLVFGAVSNFANASVVTVLRATETRPVAWICPS
jgi:hypothetical protein